MAWTTPRTWSPGETVTATLMNTHVRDNLNFLKSDLDSSIDAVMESWVADGTFLIWPSTTKPSHWSTFGTAPTVARSGAGQSDTQVDADLGGWGLKLTRGASAGGMQQTILHATGFPNHMRGKYFSAGVFCRTTVASSCRLEIYDGIGSGFSPYHDGTTPGTNQGYQWLTASRLISATATQVIVRLNIELAGSAYWSGVVARPGSLVPLRFHPCQSAVGVYMFPLAGSQTVGTDKARYLPERPGLLKHAQLRANVAPTGADLIVDVNTWDGSALTTAFTTKPKVVAAAFNGGQVPDGTYERRCLTSYHGSGSVPNGGFLTTDVDQIGSTIAGSDLMIRLGIFQFLRPQELWLPYNQVD